MALEVLSPLCTFKKSSNCIITSFDVDSLFWFIFAGTLANGLKNMARS